MQYQAPPPIFGSLIFYQTITCHENQKTWLVDQLTAILRGQKIATRETAPEFKRVIAIATANAMQKWNQFDPKKRIIVQLFIGDHRWGMDILNEDELSSPSNDAKDEDLIKGDLEFESDLRFLDEYMDEVYCSLNGRNHFMMIGSKD
ncbi:MAG: hypothetical protein AABZ60_22490 [Planctomycetota bacterium]